MKKTLLLFILALTGVYSFGQDTTDCLLEVNFTYSISGDEISFTNTSTDEPEPTYYAWAVEDVVISTQENPTFPIADFGDSLEICLVVYDSLDWECWDELCMTTFFPEDSTVSITEIPKIDFQLYPNPVADMLYISTEQSLNAKIEIISLTGRVIYTDRISGMQKSIPVNQLANGMYMIKISEEENLLYMSKFLKE